ncbi:MAG: type II toxin-antitoxin system VapC family toxin [Candidatus Bathyarchaeia archaeon]
MLNLLTFDSEAILAFFFGEAGGDQVRDILEKIENSEAEGYINIINLTEVHYILSRISPEVAEEKQKILRAYGLRVVPIKDNGLWREAAQMKCNHSLSLADAFAIATAKSYKTKLVAGRDKEFNNLGVELLRIR